IVQSRAEQKLLIVGHGDHFSEKFSAIISHVTKLFSTKAMPDDFSLTLTKHFSKICASTQRNSARSDFYDNDSS
ncbi:MAG: hypothetical protein IJ774_10790, partial [Selenomonadaceae bacterium]|nr:hypothetical protein [Selenomonadaceae bacterium]